MEQLIDEYMVKNIDELYESVTSMEDLDSYRNRVLSYKTGDQIYKEIMTRVSKEMADLPIRSLGRSPNVIIESLAISDLEKAIFRERALKLRCIDIPVVAVHSTDYFPERGVISPAGEAYHKADRNTIHFCLNGIATATAISETDTWKKRKYYVTAPLFDLIQINNPIGGCTVDFFFAGEVKLPETVKLFSSSSETENFINEVSSLESISNRGWRRFYSEVDGRELMDENGWFAGLHSTHWTGRYNKLVNSGMSKEQALRESLNTEFSQLEILKKFGGKFDLNEEIDKIIKEAGLFGYDVSLNGTQVLEVSLPN
ncbi:hypothetical protein HYW74_01355 [Candidatus Pacearchaeota archaeon]|nr:hypothetical protein [Candidatus Pacearchaeota archaeon]